MAIKSKSHRDMEDAGLIPPTPKVEIEFPTELATDEERELYQRIFEANPSAHLFSAAVAPLLVAYVRHHIAANELASVIRATDSAKDPRLYLAMLKSQKDETMALTTIASKLKLGGASIANHRGNITSATKGLPKPWEY